MTRDGSEGRASAKGGEGRILVEDAGGRRPFMRGIMIHSLMSRGIPFSVAFRTANQLRERLRGTEVVTRAELAKVIEELLGPEAFAEEAPPLSLPRLVIVGSKGKGSPFSKGFLSQSLRAAAIDPQDAFDVAREIERELHLRDVRQIDRGDLRRLAYETLCRRLGPRTGERYLVWRRFQEPERPVILLLGGTAGSGKTSLALEVAHRLGIQRVTSTDMIRQIMRIMLSQDLMPLIHASSYEAHRFVGPSAGGSEDPVVEGFRGQASVVSVGVRAMMDRAVAENASLILDGVSIVPGMIDFESYADIAHVIFLLVATLSEDAFRSRFEARARDQVARAPHGYVQNLDNILTIQDHLLELAEQHGVPIVDNDSFDTSVLSIIRHVTETLRKEGGFDASELL